MKVGRPILLTCSPSTPLRPSRMQMIVPAWASPQFVDQYHLRAFHLGGKIGKVKYTWKQWNRRDNGKICECLVQKREGPQWLSPAVGNHLKCYSSSVFYFMLLVSQTVFCTWMILPTLKLIIHLYAGFISPSSFFFPSELLTRPVTNHST